MKHPMVLWMVLMGFLKILHELFQILLFGYIFIIFRSGIIHKLKIYDEFPRFDKQWTLIEHKIAEIQIGSNPSHTIMKIQFPIQLVVALLTRVDSWSFNIWSDRCDKTWSNIYCIIEGLLKTFIYFF